MAKNIFVAGLDDFHLSQLQSLRDSSDYHFHSLKSYKNIKGCANFPVREFIEDGKRILKEFDGPIDAVVGFWDFPVSTSLPVIRASAGLEGPDLLSVLRCEHKYWSRLLQAEVVPEMIPPFEKVNPFDKDAIERCAMSYPFWLKPVKGVLSHLGFLIRDRDDFTAALEIIRKKIGRYGEPFNLILDLADLPREIREIDGYHCIAEGLISQGNQCTLEGYVHGGSVQVYGVIDSIREGRHRSSFSRYQYPSQLPVNVCMRMIEATETVMVGTGYDNGPFNIEFYWEEEKDSIHLLEINPRISKSHSLLFKMVDGEFHYKVMIDVALGRKPEFPYRKGRFNTAAKFMLRHFRDGIVRAAPDESSIARVKEVFPGTEVRINVKEGARLSDLRDQDSYSYEIGEIFLGAHNRRELLQKYKKILAMLPFTIDLRKHTP